MSTTKNENKQTTVSIERYLVTMEKQHKLAKLQSEISEFRVREIKANIEYLELMRTYNKSQPSVEQQDEAKVPENPIQYETYSEPEAASPSN